MSVIALEGSVVSVEDSSRTTLGLLRQWLGGSWGLVFSHADDFAANGFEADRWIVQVREAFRPTAIRPIALVYGPDRANTWVAQIGGLTAPTFPEEQRPGALAYENLVRLGLLSHSPVAQRYVLLIDDVCRLRWLLQYAPGASLPSPIDLAAFAEMKRVEQRSVAPTHCLREKRSRRCS